MATLEKIRSKSVFLIVIIGVALLAFIVGDALTNSRNLFGDHTTVAKVGSTKIDYTDYQRKREDLNRQLEQLKQQNPQQYANFDSQILAEMAVEQLVSEKLLDNGVKELGIESSPEQLRFYVLENPINREALSNILSQLNAAGVSVQTPAQAYEVIFNPTRNGLSEEQAKPFQNAWIAMEEQTKQLIKRQKYQQLIVGAVKANDLDKKAIYNDYVATNNVSLAFRPYGAIDEKKYPSPTPRSKPLTMKTNPSMRSTNPPRKYRSSQSISPHPTLTARLPSSLHRLLLRRSTTALPPVSPQTSKKTEW